MKAGATGPIGEVTVRELVEADLPAVTGILDATGLFPSELLPGMAAPFLARSAPHLWLVICARGAVLGFAYAEPERMADNTHNLLALAVASDRQGTGVGKSLVEAVQRRLASDGGRVLLVETSSLPDYAGTRAFYRTLGFAREASIRDFYADGEDKIIYWRRL